MTAEDNYTSIPELYEAQQKLMRAALETSAVLEHPDAKGDTSELNWTKLLEDHLPRRYRVLAKAKAIDHTGRTSDEIDVLVIDRQYSPFVFYTDARTYVPAESIYAAFECKQDLTKGHILYAANKVLSIRRLDRTSAPIVHAGGKFEPRPPIRVLGGLLTTFSGWKSMTSSSFVDALIDQPVDGRLDLGCSLADAGWSVTYADGLAPDLTLSTPEQALMFFILTALAELQQLGTVTAMDYAVWRQAITRTYACS